MQQVQSDHHNLSVYKQDVNSKIDAITLSLDSRRVSGNQLLELNHRLNKRYDTLHQREFDQTEKVKRLQVDILKLKEQLEKTL